jgi:hypothetical protein
LQQWKNLKHPAHIESAIFERGQALSRQQHTYNKSDPASQQQPIDGRFSESIIQKAFILLGRFIAPFLTAASLSLAG